MEQKTAYDFTFESIKSGVSFSLKEFEGKVLLIVNTASKCGFTSQYAGLEKLYKTYAEKGLMILGVPSNDFGKQEPGSSSEIVSFCQTNYGVTFPLTAKVHVRGKEKHPFYIWAREQLGFGTAPKWNFHKYLISRKGDLLTYFNSTTSPENPRLIQAIETALETF
jgi:glutathione peroxidase